MPRRVLSLALLPLLLFATDAQADYLEVRRSATLRASPDRDAEVVQRVDNGTFLDLLDEEQTDGYYRVQAPEGDQEGWIYRTLVRRYLGEMPEQPSEREAPPTPASRAGQELHVRHCLYGWPIGAPASNDLIVREIYTLSSNDETKFVDWAAYVVTRETIGPTEDRNSKADPLLDREETLEPEDYAGANDELQTDRGHQVPLASFTSTPYWKDTNYLSNITPQRAALNRGPWEELESLVCTLAQREDVQAVHCLTGPLYERPMPAPPHADEPHRIPSAYSKVIAVETDHDLRTATFYIPFKAKRVR